jgi:hypothetical protein
MAATRKTTPAPKRPDNGTVHFSLDTFEREKTYEPFAADLGGRRVVMTDPQELEWVDLAELESPAEFIDLCMAEEDKTHLLSLGLTSWQMNGLMDAYMAHYGIGNRGKGRA